MINVSSGFKDRMNTSRDFVPYAEITLANGNTLTLTEDEFTTSNNTIIDGAGSQSFPLGVAIQKYITLEFVNNQDQYAGVDFFGAKIRLYLNFELADGTVERIEKGTYTVISPESHNQIISITAYDDMYKADKEYTTSLTYPQTAATILRDICSKCDINLATTEFLHSDFIIQAMPEEATYRDMIGYIAMIACGNARISNRNVLQIISYDFSEWETEGKCFELTDWTSPTINYNPSVITGVKTTVTTKTTDDNGNETETETDLLVGTDDYCLEIDNPLIESSENTVLSWIYDALSGVAFYPFSGDLIGNPLIEFMDLVKFTDWNGHEKQSFITDINYIIDGYTTVSNNAPAPEVNNASYTSEISKISAKTRKLIEEEKTDRQQAIDALNKTLNESSGMYVTEEKQADGSTITYLHDKKNMADSSNVIKISAEAIGVSNDGGKTYPYGLQLSGELIAKLLYVVGINADYIDTGALTVKDDDGNIIFQADMDNKTVTISGDHVTIGGKTVTQAINDATSTADSAKSTAESANSTAQEALNTAAAAKNMTMQLSNDYQAIPVDANGNYTTFPTCTTTVQVMYGNTDITSNCSFTVTKSDNISGLWNSARYTYMVYSLTADSAWVDIKATYLNSLSVTKRFTVTKLYSGTNGKMRIVQSGMTLTQERLEKLGKVGYYNKNWATEEDLSDVSIGDVVMWSVTNSTKETTAYILIEVDGITTDEEGDYISGTSQGFIDSGADGTNGDAYTLESSANVFQFDANGTANPSEITFNAYSKTGNSGLKAYNGRFVLEYTKDGSSWTTIYTSPLDENSLTYPFTEKWLAIDGNEGAFDCGDGTYLIADTMSGTWISDITALRCKIYASGGTTTLLDMKVVDRVVSVEALTQEDIFNLLTNNGEAKGLYLEGGQLYISFTYAKGGTLAVGGSANKRGEIIIYDSNDNKIGYWDNTGINATKGTFSGALAGATGIFSGSLSAATGTFTGALKAATGSFSGEITASSGTIGGFKLASNALYSNRTSLTSNTYGVYISTGGISTGNGGAYITLSSGRLYGGISETPTGYVSFNSYYKDTGIYGIRICGKGCIALLTDGGFGIGSYYEMGSESTITIGQSGTVSYISSITEYFTISNICTNLSIVNGNATWNTVNATFAKTFNQKAMAFTKGLMTTTV